MRSRSGREPDRRRSDRASRALRSLRESPGEPLAPAARQALEPRFGHSFAEVRVHPGTRGQAAAAAVGSPAFTVGSDIAFAGERYDAETPGGLALLAHELTHVVQNERAGAARLGLNRLSSREDPAESEAEAVTAGARGPSAVAARPSAVIARAPGDAERAKNAGDFFGTLSSGSNLGESWLEGLVRNDWWKKPDSIEGMNRVFNRSATRDTLGILGDTFGTVGGTFNLASGIGRLMNGGGVEAGLDTAKGALDTTSGVAGMLGGTLFPGHMGLARLEGGAGLASAGLDVGRGLHKAITSDDLNQATEGAYQTAGGIASGISSWGDATANPLVSAGGRALGLGLTAGQGIVSTSDRISRERGYFENDTGESQSGSSEAADWGRSVDEWFGHDNWFLDKLGGVAGGVVAAGGGIANSAYTYGRRAVDAVGDFFSGPSLWDQMRALQEQKAAEANAHQVMTDLLDQRMREETAADLGW